MLHWRLRSREACRDDRSGTRGLRATAGGSRSAAGIRRDEARLLAADVRCLLAGVVRLLVVAVVVLIAAVMAVAAPTVTGLGIRGAEDQSERRGEHSQGQSFSSHCKILLLRNTNLWPEGAETPVRNSPPGTNTKSIGREPPTSCRAVRRFECIPKSPVSVRRITLVRCVTQAASDWEAGWLGWQARWWEDGEARRGDRRMDRGGVGSHW